MYGYRFEDGRTQKVDPAMDYGVSAGGWPGPDQLLGANVEVLGDDVVVSIGVMFAAVVRGSILE